MDRTVQKDVNPVRRAGILALAVVMTFCLSFPQLAFAVVRVDGTELAQGENAVGGGTACYADSSLEMTGVTAEELFTDEDLSVNFNGGNDIGNVNVEGSASVDLSFAGENEVEEVHASGTSDVTINANGCNEFEEIEAIEQSNLTINVTGENEFEEIVGRDDANITIRGTDCQRKDVIELGEDEEDTAISTERGTLTIDHVTVNVEAEESFIGSTEGNVVIDTSKIAGGDESEYVSITAGGTLDVIESVIEITGTIRSDGQMTIRHSDIEADEPDDEYDESPYRIWSKTGIELIAEENGEVLKGEIGDDVVFFVDTDDNDGVEVDLEADGDPAYYRCAGDSLPKTGDWAGSLVPIVLLIAGAASVAFAARRRYER